MTLELVFSIVGAVFVFAVSLLLIGMAVTMMLEARANLIDVKSRREIKAMFLNIDRWCSYEFPQVGFMAREVAASVGKYGWRFDESKFRERLRSGEWKAGDGKEK